MGGGECDCYWRETGTEPTERIERSGSGAAAFDRNDVVKARKDVRVIETLEIAKSDHRKDQP